MRRIIKDHTPSNNVVPLFDPITLQLAECDAALEAVSARIRAREAHARQRAHAPQAPFEGPSGPPVLRVIQGGRTS